MNFNLPIGMCHEIERAADKHACTDHLGGGDRGLVFATPVLVGWMEEAAYTAVRPGLPAGFDTVGTSVNISHTAPTPLGMNVRVVAELTETKGRLLTFKVKAYDERGKIAEGIHGRAIIEVEKFLESVSLK